jgi:hypothetical protein
MQSIASDWVHVEGLKDDEIQPLEQAECRTVLSDILTTVMVIIYVLKAIRS